MRDLFREQANGGWNCLVVWLLDCLIDWVGDWIREQANGAERNERVSECPDSR